MTSVFRVSRDDPTEEPRLLACALALALCCLAAGVGAAQPPAAPGDLRVAEVVREVIPDGDAEGLSAALTLPAQPGSVAGVAVRVEVRHLRRGDLSLTLTAPSGREAQLFVGDPHDERRHLTGVLGRLALDRFRGEPLAGTWTLMVIDRRSGARGSLVRWELLATAQPQAPAAREQGAEGPEGASVAETSAVRPEDSSRWAPARLAALLEGDGTGPIDDVRALLVYLREGLPRRGARLQKGLPPR